MSDRFLIRHSHRQVGAELHGTPGLPVVIRRRRFAPDRTADRHLPAVGQGNRVSIRDFGRRQLVRRDLRQPVPALLQTLQPRQRRAGDIPARRGEHAQLHRFKGKARQRQLSSLVPERRCGMAVRRHLPQRLRPVRRGEGQSHIPHALLVVDLGGKIEVVKAVLAPPAFRENIRRPIRSVVVRTARHLQRIQQLRKVRTRRRIGFKPAAAVARLAPEGRAERDDPPLADLPGGDRDAPLPRLAVRPFGDHLDIGSRRLHAEGRTGHVGSGPVVDHAPGVDLPAAQFRPQLLLLAEPQFAPAAPAAADYAQAVQF